MRERLEPLALTESLPHLTAGEIRELESIHERIAADADLSEFMVLDRAFHLGSYAGCASEQLSSTRDPAVELHPALPPCLHDASAASSGVWIVDHEHRLILDAIERRDTEDAERYLAGHIRRTRIELAAHPEVFAPSTARSGA